MLFGRRICYFGGHGRVAASRANEFLVKGAEIDLLFCLITRAAIGYTRADFIFDDDAEQPAIAGVDGRDFQRRDGRDFGQILALRVAEVSFRPKRVSLALPVCVSPRF